MWYYDLGPAAFKNCLVTLEVKQVSQELVTIEEMPKNIIMMYELFLKRQFGALGGYP